VGSHSGTDTDGSRRLSRSARSMPARSLTPIRSGMELQHAGSHPRHEGFSTMGPSRSSASPPTGADWRRAASFSSGPSARLGASTPPTAEPQSTGDVAAGLGLPADCPRSDAQRSSLSNALHAISETLRSGSSHDEAVGTADAGIEETLLSEGQRGLADYESDGSDSHDVEAALPPDFEARIRQGHPVFQRRLDAADVESVGGDMQQAPKIGNAQTLAIDAVTGLINSIVSLPIMMSFAVIIYQDSFFSPYSGALVRLVLLSAAIHQLAFTALSTIVFAVGQVQDVGIIFCSSIASNVVAECMTAGATDGQTLATVLLTLTLSTLIVGVAIVIVGRLRLASTVQYMPLSVIGGYLGYVGFFICISGAGVSTGRKFDTAASILHFTSEEVLSKLAPAALGAVVLWLVTHRIRSPWALPAVLLMMPAVFFAGLYAAGSDIDAARAHGWFQAKAASPPKHFWDVWKLFDFPHMFSSTNGGGVLWSAMPRQLPTVLALAFVVAFGSSLDVAAIQQDNPEELDYNKELVTVGVSNIVAGLTGAGYPGSYIFSQTIFSMRAKVTTRVCGAVVVLVELACFASPFNLVEYLPLFFFGSLMLWIGFEITKDWLLSARSRMTSLEYVLLWMTFGAITVLGLEGGIAVGLLLAALFFAFQYARVNVTAFHTLPSRSGFVRTFQQRTVLEIFGGRIVAVSLSGYIFFGSSVKIGDNVSAIVHATLLASESGDPRGAAVMEEGDGVHTNLALPRKAVAMLRQEAEDAGPLEGSLRSRATAAVNLAPRFCLLDFRRVSGMDGTAGRQFSTLRRRLQRLGIELVLTTLPRDKPEVHRLLLANAVIAAPGCIPVPGMCRAFPTLDQGLFYCEETLLECAVHYGLCRPAIARVSLTDVLRTHLQHPKPLLPRAGMRYGRAATEMATFMTARSLQPGEVAPLCLHACMLACLLSYDIPSICKSPVHHRSHPGTIADPSGQASSCRVCTTVCNPPATSQLYVWKRPIQHLRH